jgi:hypothetical protein
MWPKIRDAHRMMTADDELRFARPKVIEMIEHLREAGYTQMRAYSHLAKMVGKSPRWVRRIVGRSPEAEVRLRDAWNIAAAYDRLCARVEAAADAQEARNAIIEGKLHAAREGRSAMGEGDERRRVALAPLVDEVGQ